MTKIAIYNQHSNSFFVRYKRKHHILYDNEYSLCGKFKNDVLVRDDWYGEYEIIPNTIENYKLALSTKDDYGNGMCKACYKKFEERKIL